MLTLFLLLKSKHNDYKENCKVRFFSEFSNNIVGRRGNGKGTEDCWKRK